MQACPTTLYDHCKNFLQRSLEYLSIHLHNPNSRVAPHLNKITTKVNLTIVVSLEQTEPILETYRSCFIEMENWQVCCTLFST